MALLFFVVGLSSHGADRRGFSVGQSAWYAVVGAVVGFALSFLFTPVAAQAIAIVGVNPVSGMTLITVVLTILALVATGLKGTGGMFIALIVGCAVCTALSTSGALISDFKIGYWIGSTPRNQEMLEIRRHHPGVSRGGLCDSAHGFRLPLPGGRPRNRPNGLQHEGPARSPGQHDRGGKPRDSSRIAANQPWLLYGLGGFVAVMLYMAGVPMLAFALGIYIPIPINMAVLAGAFVSYIVGKTGGSEKVRKARQDQGILIASGLMAGGAIFGIIAAILRQPALGAPIRFISIGEKFSLEHTKAGEPFLQSKPTARSGTRASGARESAW